MPKKFSVVRNRKLAAALNAVLFEIAGTKVPHIDVFSYPLDSDLGPLMYAYARPSTIDAFAWVMMCFKDVAAAKQRFGHWKWNQYFHENGDIQAACSELRAILSSVNVRPLKTS